LLLLSNQHQHPGSRKKWIPSLVIFGRSSHSLRRSTLATSKSLFPSQDKRKSIKTWQKSGRSSILVPRTRSRWPLSSKSQRLKLRPKLEPWRLKLTKWRPNWLSLTRLSAFSREHKNPQELRSLVPTSKKCREQLRNCSKTPIQSLALHTVQEPEMAAWPCHQWKQFQS